MIRTLLYTHRSNLEMALSATLGEDISLCAATTEEAVLAQVESNQVDIFVLDGDECDESRHCLNLIAKVRDAGVPVMAITGDDRRCTALDLMEHGVCDQFRNPPSPLEMTLAIRRAHEQAMLRRELAQARQNLTHVDSFGQLIGRSSKMQSVYNLIQRVSGLETCVMITGESGTGKELVARAIHHSGPRSTKPFVAVSCGAIPETLIEAELFGHEKGSFTGANGMRRGLLEMAGDGTLFLDEIGELTPLMQVKLLRVLQQNEFMRLGGNRTLPLKARVVVATHRDLPKMVAAEQFRQDLFFRINVINIQMPALRERTEDIPALTRNFVQQFSESCKKHVVGIRPEALSALSAYEWPGNVRELQNAIHRAVIVSEGEFVELTDLPDELQPEEVVGPMPVATTFEHRLREYKRQIALEALDECNGNKTQAAQSLQISRAYLHRLLRVDEDDASAQVA